MQNATTTNIKRAIFLLALVTLFGLPMKALTPVSVQRSYSYVTDNVNYTSTLSPTVISKHQPDDDEQVTRSQIAFPSRNIMLGILLLGVYVFFVRKNVSSRKADF